jgi:hypothetical protein
MVGTVSAPSMSGILKISNIIDNLDRRILRRVKLKFIEYIYIYTIYICYTIYDIYMLPLKCEISYFIK